MEALTTKPRLALDNILFATDFSRASQPALSFACAFATWFESKLFIVHAVIPEPHYSVPLDPLPVALDPLWQEAALKMTDLEASPAVRAVSHETVIEQGSPWEVVSRQIQKQPMDLLVLASHGRRGLRKLVLGSEAERIFRQSSGPVLTVGPRARAIDPGRWTPKTIIFPTDFSPTSLHSLPFALALAEESQATLVVLHLTPLFPFGYRPEIESDLTDQLKVLVPEDAGDWCRLEFVVRFEFAAEGILQVAEERQSDLIVMGVRKASALAASHSPWETASEVVSKACCPVITVRA